MKNKRIIGYVIKGIFKSNGFYFTKLFSYMHFRWTYADKSISNGKEFIWKKIDAKAMVKSIILDKTFPQVSNIEIIPVTSIKMLY